MTEPVLAELERELARVGVRGRDAQRLLSESREHLRDLGGDAERFGSAAEIARAAAGELATTRTRRAAYEGFAALTLVGLAYAALVLLAGRGTPPDLTGGEHAWLGVLATVALVLLPQVAFVAGCLALLRSLRLRDAETVGSAELALLRRRTNVALAAGLLTVGAAALWAYEFRADVTAWPVLLGCALLAVVLVAAIVAAGRSARPRPTPGERSGDVFDDLPILTRCGLEPGARLAAVTAAVVFVAGLLGGWAVEGDPGSGLVRGGFEAVALLACYALLARPLALRRTSAA